VAGLVLESERLRLVAPDLALAHGMLDFLVRNEAHLARWSPPPPPGVHTEEHWREFVAKSAAAFEAGQVVRLWLTPREQPARVMGTIGFSQISRGPFCSCVMGYQIDHEFEGRGLMREALNVAIRYMFADQKLHRIGANYRPENVRSGRLLARLGFRIDGLSRNYLFIDGAWRDHILTSLTNDAFEAAWLKAG
jgi:ribosomal-protein-alanine N-acetyltransferase